MMAQRLFTPIPHPMTAPSVALDAVTVAYDHHLALDDVSFVLQQGDHVALVGPNGAGKSTLFNVIAGIVKPTAGKVSIYGSQPQDHTCVGYVPQRNRIDWRFPVTVADVVMMGRTGKIGLFRRAQRQDHEAVAVALEQVRMADLGKRQIGELSGGQQQRAFLARALAQESELLLLDEPFAGLDLPSQEVILDILVQMRQQAMTVLVATHDLNQAAQNFPQIMLLNHRLIALGTPAQVLTPQTLALAYGSHLHILPAGETDLLLADSCCDGGQPPVAPLLERGESGAVALMANVTPFSERRRAA